MALFFTFTLELYHATDAARVVHKLVLNPLVVLGREISFIDIHIFKRMGFWYLEAQLNGVGHSPSELDPELNQKHALLEIIERAYHSIETEKGIRRALCSYEAQDSFEDSYGLPDLDQFDIPDLVYDRCALPQTDPCPAAQPWGKYYVRNVAPPPWK